MHERVREKVREQVHDHKRPNIAAAAEKIPAQEYRSFPHVVDEQVNESYKLLCE